MSLNFFIGQSPTQNQYRIISAQFYKVSRISILHTPYKTRHEIYITYYIIWVCVKGRSRGPSAICLGRETAAHPYHAKAMGAPGGGAPVNLGLLRDPPYEEISKSKCLHGLINRTFAIWVTTDKCAFVIAFLDFVYYM